MFDFLMSFPIGELEKLSKVVDSCTNYAHTNTQSTSYHQTLLTGEENTHSQRTKHDLCSISFETFFVVWEQSCKFACILRASQDINNARHIDQTVKPVCPRSMVGWCEKTRAPMSVLSHSHDKYLWLIALHYSTGKLNFPNPINQQKRMNKFVRFNHLSCRIPGFIIILI